MSLYRLLFFEGGFLARAERIEAENDIAALEIAARSQAPSEFELWRGDCRLARFKSALRRRLDAHRLSRPKRAAKLGEQVSS